MQNNDIKIQLGIFFSCGGKHLYKKNHFSFFRDIVVVEEEDETADYDEDVKTKDLVSYCHDEDQLYFTLYIIQFSKL